MANKELIQALNEFKKAYNKLNEVMLNNNSIINETESIKLYPFDKSFDELEVNEWIYETIKELENI